VQLIIGGEFTHVGADSTGEVAANHIAMWDGTAWQPLGAGTDGPVDALTVWDPDGDGPLPGVLVAAGRFVHAGSAWSGGVARWDGSAWSGFGWGIDGSGASVDVWDPDGLGPLPSQLVVGGSFAHAGADSTGQIDANNVARWDGTAWRTLGDGVPAAVRRVLAFSDHSGYSRIAVQMGSQLFFYDGQQLAETSFDQPMVFSSIAVWDPDGGGPTPAELVMSGAHSDYGPFCWNKSIGTYFCYRYSDVFGRWDGERWHWFAADRMVGPMFSWVGHGDGQGDQLVAGESGYQTLWAMNPAALPDFSVEPVDARVVRHGTATFTFDIGANTSNVQWTRDGILLSDGATSRGSVISGSETRTLTIAGVEFGDAGRYEAIVYGPCDSYSTRAALLSVCGTADFNGDGSVATDADIEAFFACLSGDCCPTCETADFNGDGAVGTDADIESFFRVLAGGPC
jgi:hypothetical protein